MAKFLLVQSTTGDMQQYAAFCLRKLTLMIHQYYKLKKERDYPPSQLELDANRVHHGSLLFFNFTLLIFLFILFGAILGHEENSHQHRIV